MNLGVRRQWIPILWKSCCFPPLPLSSWVSIPRNVLLLRHIRESGILGSSPRRGNYFLRDLFPTPWLFLNKFGPFCVFAGKVSWEVHHGEGEEEHGGKNYFLRYLFPAPWLFLNKFGPFCVFAGDVSWEVHAAEGVW